MFYILSQYNTDIRCTAITFNPSAILTVSLNNKYSSAIEMKERISTHTHTHTQRERERERERESYGRKSVEFVFQLN